jgi:DNA-binding transcriptional LysR family regulator
MRLPSLKYLRTFQIAGRHLSFKEAADELAITPSAVSQQVKNLEAYIGVPLFERRTRSLEFTDAGRLYFEYLNTMFSRLESETEQLRAQYGRKIVRVSAPPFFASEVLLKRIASFQSTSSELDIRVSTQPSRQKTHPALADISILLGQGDWPGLVTHRLFQRCFVVAGAPSLLKQGKVRSPVDLNKHTLLVHENRADAWDTWARQAGVPAPRPKKLMRFDSMSEVARAAEQGLGFALVSWPVGADWFRSGSLVRVFEEEVQTGEYFFLAHLPDEDQRPEVRSLLDWMLRELKNFG